MAMRIYQPMPLAVGMMDLDDNASHHLARVLRAAVGDEIILFNGEGGEYHAVIRQVTKKCVTVEALNFVARETESPLRLTLAQGVARGEKMDFVIQKAVELGVSEIVPVISERCNVRLDQEREQKRVHHWQAVIISACEQSGRNRLPILRAPISLPDWVEQDTAEKKFVLSPYAATKLADIQQKPVSASVLIGPEGGLSEKEIQLAEQHHFVALNLGPRVLRTETAAVAALTVMQLQFGDF